MTIETPPGPGAAFRAARGWFGWGDWTAPFWFVGMEPGGDGASASHESWQRLGGGELVDCRAHHFDSGFTRWHDGNRPPTQPTWRRLVQLLLAFKGEPTNLEAVSLYQRDRLGASGDETALIELSALHAPNLDTAVDRTVHREARIDLIRQRFDEYRPHFVVFYGVGYRNDYERVVGGPFDLEGISWRGQTLCILAPHPVARGRSPEYWTDLGREMRAAVASGAGAPPIAVTAHRKPRPGARLPLTAVRADCDEVPILRAGVVAGRVVREGKLIRVESRESDGTYRILGYYEEIRADKTFTRKVREIDCILDSWRKIQVADAMKVKASWRRRHLVYGFSEQPGALSSGCTVVEDDGIPIAHVYKIAPASALWVKVHV